MGSKGVKCCPNFSFVDNSNFDNFLFSALAVEFEDRFLILLITVRFFFGMGLQGVKRVPNF